MNDSATIRLTPASIAAREVRRAALCAVRWSGADRGRAAVQPLAGGQHMHDMRGRGIGDDARHVVRVERVADRHARPQRFEQRALRQRAGQPDHVVSTVHERTNERHAECPVAPAMSIFMVSPSAMAALARQ